MPRHDDYADKFRRRRRQYQDNLEEYPTHFFPRSGTVTAVGVLNILIGSLFALGSVCSLLGGLLLFGIAQHWERNVAQQGGQAPNVSGIVGIITVAVTIVVLLIGIANIVTGIFVIRRHHWARIVTFLIAGLAAVGSCFQLVNTVLMMERTLANDGQIVVVIFNLVFACVCLGYSVFAFVVLANPNNAREFE